MLCLWIVVGLCSLGYLHCCVGTARRSVRLVFGFLADDDNYDDPPPLRYWVKFLPTWPGLIPAVLLLICFVIVIIPVAIAELLE